MPDYEINTFAELCQRIIDSDGKGVENLVAVTSPGAFACTILKAEKYTLTHFPAFKG